MSAALFLLTFGLMSAAYAADVGAINYAVEPGAKVGPVQIGLFCLPNGELRWEDIRLPTDKEARDAIAEALGASIPSAAIVEISLQTVHLKLCVPGAPKVLGKAKANGVARWRWRVETPGNATPYRDYIMDTPFTLRGVDPRTSSALVLASLRQSAQKFSTAFTQSAAK